jgi:heat shock protein HslJ
MQVPHARLRRAAAPLLLVMLAVVMAVGGCATTPPAGGGGGGGGGGAGSLAGRSFVSESVTENGRPRPLVEGTEIALTFPSDGGISARAGCNHMSGSLEVQRHRLMVGDLTMTEMACSPELGEQDEWLAGLLTADPAYRLRGDSLRLQVGGTVVELVDQEVAEPGQPLEGPTWLLDTLIDGDALSTLPPGTGASLVFGDGGVGLNVENCNVGNGDVAIGESEIEVGPLMMTLRACEEDPAMVEAAVTSVLQGTITYEIAGDHLTLRHPSGKGLILRAGLVQYHKSGGLLGTDERLTVYQSGRAVFQSRQEAPSERPLAPEELTALVEALEGSDFATLPPYSVDPNIADGFIYEVTYQGRQVTAGDGAVPERLAPVIDQLNQVIEGFVLVDPPPGLPLEGTTWQLEGMFAEDGDVRITPPEGTGATLVFDGASVGVRIQNCNQGGADVTIGESEIEVGPLMLTRMACQDGPSIVEAALTSVLQGTVTYGIDADVLTISHPSGQGLVLRAVPDVPPTAG